MLLLALFTAVNSACNRDKDSTEEEDDSTEQLQQSKDESFVSNESDVNLDEVNSLLMGNVFGKTGGISGATIDDSTLISEKKIVITYNGLNASGTRNRVGQVTVQLVNGSKWSDPGAILKVVYSGLVVTHISTGKSIKFNGFHTILNIDGGRAFVDSLVQHAIRGQMTVAFDNGASRTWNVARKRLIRHIDLVYSVEVRGDTTLAGMSNIVIWGVNRGGNAFYTQIQQPIQWSSLCPLGPLSGVKIHKGIKREITATFGVDQSGVSVNGDCPYGFKIEWVNIRNVSKKVVIGY